MTTQTHIYLPLALTKNQSDDLLFSPCLNPELFGSLAADLLRKNISIQFTARGQSMTPYIRNGETVKVLPVNPANLKTGHIVLHRTNHTDSTVLHRIIKITKTNNNLKIYHICGDNFVCQPQKVSSTEILGIADTVIRNGKTKNVNSFFQRISGIITANKNKLKITFARLSQR